MSTIRPFRGIRPAEGLAAEIAALPYDVYSSSEARKIVQSNPMSFLKIDRAETLLPEGTDIYSPEVYRKARQTLDDMIRDGAFVQDEGNRYYIYALTMDGRTQTGLVACASVDDYLDNVILKHENTLAAKEEDRIRHVDACSAQTGPIFLAYRGRTEVRELLNKIKERKKPEADFRTEDSIRHRVWKIEEEEKIARLTGLFGEMEHTYIADGHHRAASAVAVSRMRREAYPGYTGREEFNYFLSVLFPDDELMILDYNRVLKDLNGYSPEELLEKLSGPFQVEKAEKAPCRPEKKGEMGFFLDGSWYRLEVRKERCRMDPVEALDVAYLQREALEPLWGIKDPKTDRRIDFVGGIRGLSELEERCRADCAAAFSMYPTSMAELFGVADAGLLMPPKSTWFEPKLRSGLFIHKIER